GDHGGRPAARRREDRCAHQGLHRAPRQDAQGEGRRDHGRLMVEIDPTRLPRHVAVIMDGNGRWAEQRGLSRLQGHRVGKESVRAVVEASRRLGIRYLSLYAFSTENWRRPPREVAPEGITAGTLARHLGTNGIPDPDLLIRTSGEMRLSNFFLWQLAYTEMYVTDTLWPDFRERDYLQALAFFQQRQRRFGRTAAQVEREKLRAAN